MKKHKPSTSKQGNGSQNTAEVFVLPPDLLAKLGINLENIEHSKVETPPLTSPIKETEQSIDHSISHNLPDSENTSSILETANLMKVSVFLSPTFLQTPTLIPDEEKIAGDESVINTNTIISSEHDLMSHHSNRSCDTRIYSAGKQNDPDLLHATIINDYNTEIPMEQVIGLENCELIKKYEVENQDNDLTLPKMPYKNNKSYKMSIDKVVSSVDDPPPLESTDIESNQNILTQNIIEETIDMQNRTEKKIIPKNNNDIEGATFVRKGINMKKPITNNVIDSKILHDIDKQVSKKPLRGNENLVSISQINFSGTRANSEEAAYRNEEDNVNSSENAYKNNNNKTEIGMNENKKTKSSEAIVIDSKILHDIDKQASKQPLQGNENLVLISQINFSGTLANSEETAYKNEENTVNSSENTYKNNNNKTEIGMNENKKNKSSEAIVIDSKILHDIDKQVSKKPLRENENLVSITQINFSGTQANSEEAASENEENNVNSIKNTYKNSNNITEIDTNENKITKSSEAIVIDSKILHDIDKQVYNEPLQGIKNLVSITQINFSGTQANSEEAASKNEENNVNSSENTYKNSNNITEIDTNENKITKSPEAIVIDCKILHDIDKQVSNEPLQGNENLVSITQINFSGTQANSEEAASKNEENNINSSENTYKNSDNKTEIDTNENKKIKSSEAIVIDSKILCDIDKHVSNEPLRENENLVSITQISLSCTQTNHSEVTNKIENKCVSSSESLYKNNNNKTEINKDRVTEIASYLSKIANKRKKIRNKEKKVQNVVKVNPAIAKLCVQGVEKPGGLVHDEKVELVRVSKTYKRASIKQQIPRKLAISETNTTLVDAFQLINSNNQSDTEMNVTDVTLLARQNRFCICFDFGNLAHYDCEILYEHIHFWLHNNNECDIETLYSIYNQDYDNLIQTADFVEDSQIKTDITTIQNTLCWNELNATVNHDETKLDILDSISTTKTNSVRKRTKKIPKTDSSKSSKPVKCAKSSHTHLIENGKNSENTTIVEAGHANQLHVRPTRSKSTSYETPKLLKKSSESDELSNLSKSMLKRKLTPITVVNDTELPKTSNSIDNAVNAKNTLSNNVVSTETIPNINNKTQTSTVKCGKKNRVIKGKGIDEPTHGNSEKANSKTKSSTYQNKDNSSPAKNIQTNKSQNIMSVKTVHNINNKTPKSTTLKSLETNELAEGKDTKEQPIKGNSIKLNSDFTKVDVKSEQTFNIVTKIETELTHSYNTSPDIGKSIKTPSNTEKCTKSIAESELSKHSEEDLTLETPKSIKRPLNISPVNQPSKKVKNMESKSKYNPLKPLVIQDEASHCGPSEVEVQITSEKTYSATKPSDFPDIEVTDSKISVNILDTTNVDSTIPDDSMDILIEYSSSQDTTLNETTLGALTKCGVCAKIIKESKWEAHMWKRHDYLAWRDGEDPLDLEDEIEVKKHLQSIANTKNGLVCKWCHVSRKNAKTFLGHVKSCIHSNPSTSLVSEEDEVSENDSLKEYDSVTCGVCRESVQKFEWIEHMRIEHKYLAWTSEETPLNLDDEVEVKKHLNTLSKKLGGLLCNNCNLRMCYVKKYFKHIEKCEDCEFVAKDITALTHKKVSLNIPAVVTCGVCKLEVKGKQWVRHIQVAHEYMAWIGGKRPLDTDNPEKVKEHLDAIVRVAGELICMKCGERRRHAYAYMQHRAACDRTGFDMNLDDTQPNSVDKGKFVCGVCHEMGKLKDWQNHAMSKHYNIAWKAGEIPINLRNPYAVEKYLKKYKSKRGSLICLNCKQSRASCYGFYAHILTCGRTPEEIEGVMDDCEICNNKYLCIYRNQHMAAHKDSEMRRIKREEKSKMSKEEVSKEPEPLIQPFGKRKAAVKAKTVIKKHSSNLFDGKPVCSCGRIFQNKEEFEQHTCAAKITDDGNESDVSVKIEQESAESEDDEYVDSAVSEEEEDPRLNKRYRAVESANKLLRMSYKVDNVFTYLTSAYRDFAKLHYTSESLYNVWRNSEYQIVPAEEREAYLPLVAESCKIRFGSQLQDGWTTYKRFTAKKTPGYSFFTGGATQCIAWVPPNLVEEFLSNYLAVSVHRTADVPRHSATERPRFPASLQIWHLGQFQAKPYCALFIAHDFGIVWAMDWCPSGARDGSVPIVPHDRPDNKESTPMRLGLLAIACSNGSAYILAVPSPPARDDIEDPPMYKLKPVAELRLTMTLQRRVYQATSIKWSQQNGHSTIIVGYSDGTTALFDLNTESPFLVTTEGGITIYYPYQDKRSESSSITSVGLFTTTNESYSDGGQWSTSMTGGTINSKGPRPSSRCHVAVSSALHAAHWPAVTLSGDIPFMRAVSEMEWWGGGRRAGAGRSWAACARCGRAASFAPPVLRLHAHHPAHSEMKKLMAALLLMVPLVQKPKHSQNDELSIVMEPLTYDDTIEKYGLQLNTVQKNRGDQSVAHQISTQNEFRPDRFPLSDVVAMAFCPSTKFHDRLALATHTGIVFILNTL